MPLSKTRWAATPDTPTFDGAGVPGLRASFWHGLWAPRGTPKDGIATLFMPSPNAIEERQHTAHPCLSRNHVHVHGSIGNDD
jgi:hypothetical protein